MKKNNKVMLLVLAGVLWLFFAHTSNLYAQVSFSTELAQGRLVVIVDVTRLARKTILSEVRLEVDFYDSFNKYIDKAIYSYSQWNFPVFESGYRYQMKLPHEYASATFVKGKLAGVIGPPGKVDVPSTSIGINSGSKIGTDTNTRHYTLQRSSRTGDTSALVNVLNVSSGRNYFTTELYIGTTVYTDRKYVYTEVPSFLQGETYIITANEDKFSKGTDFLNLNIDQEAIIYIAHDDRYTSKPSWLSKFIHTHHDLVFPAGNRKVTLSLYAKHVSAGHILFGGNITPMETGNYGMYTVIVRKLKR